MVRVVAVGALVIVGGAAAAQDAPDVVIKGVRDIVVNGRARHCLPMPGDPMNKLAAPPDRRLYAILPAGDGRYGLRLNQEQVTGASFWQRTGVGLDQYVFRAPGGDRPMCIGGVAPDIGSFAGFRRILDIAPYRGKRIRFSAWVATGGARHVTFFLAVGAGDRKLFNGGTTDHVPFGGDHGWTPVLLETGPLADKADHISYGFHLHGPGDVWLYRPTLEIVTDEPAPMPTRDVITIGTDKR